MTLETKDVFGVATELRPMSYVDRGGLDKRITRLLDRDLHLALRGSSKAGKSWLRQRLLPEAIVVQCRFNHTVVDLYRLALNELGISLEVTSTSTRGFEGNVSAETEFGSGLIAKVRARLGLGVSRNDSTTSAPALSAVHDLKIISEIIKLSGRRLVIEDFHYLPVAERKWLASDLKALWENGLYAVIIGIWTHNNMLLNFNGDLGGRVKEIPIGWTADELRSVIEKGASDLNLAFDPNITELLVNDSYGNVGILQSLLLEMLDELSIFEAPSQPTMISDGEALEAAAIEYAEQLVPIFATFANNVAAGIRIRKNSTAIYAHALAAILEQEDHSLIKGVTLDVIYEITHGREPRIQKGNLKAALGNIESLQVDEEDRGLVLAFNPTNSEVTVVNRDLLFYRKYNTVAWPWEDLIRESSSVDEDEVD